MKVLVTGGLGFIGSHTVVELQNEGFEVVIIDNLSNSSEDVLKGIVAITGKTPIFEKMDLREKAAVQKAMESVSSDVQQTVATVQRISTSAIDQAATTDQAVAVSHNTAKKIKDTSQILEMIQSIALQTRLLGLNASIEAARAGIHGRSFSILAGEMQKLAQNSPLLWD